jgi:hypothetical protein
LAILVALEVLPLLPVIPAVTPAPAQQASFVFFAREWLPQWMALSTGSRQGAGEWITVVELVLVVHGSAFER